MDDVRAPARGQHEFQHGPTEEGEAIRIVGFAVDATALKEPMGRVGLDEEAGDPVDLARVDATVDPPIEIGDAQLPADLAAPLDQIVAQRIVPRQKDLDLLPEREKLAREPVHDITEPASFCDRRTLGADHGDIHTLIPDWLFDGVRAETLDPPTPGIAPQTGRAECLS